MKEMEETVQRMQASVSDTLAGLARLERDVRGEYLIAYA